MITDVLRRIKWLSLIFFIFCFANSAIGLVHDYGVAGDDPATKQVDESARVASDDIVRNGRYQLSTRFDLRVSATQVSAFKYKKGADGSDFYNFDVARFASDEVTPEISIRLIDGTEIQSVEVYPERYYQPEGIIIGSDKKSLTITMSDKLPYCIVNINGTLTDKKMAGIPMLAIIMDPLERDKPDINSANVLNFGQFSRRYLVDNPITDQEGQICRPSGTVSDTSRNTQEVFIWDYEAGKFVSSESSEVQFPDMRIRERDDVSDAFQAALDIVRKSQIIDTIYFPAGTYIWSGLSIKNWDGNRSDGKLNIYLDEDALLVNRLQACKQSLEPAIGIWHSSNITISGRGIIDGNACYTIRWDRKDARDTPHQGGAMLVHCSDITFNDTYVRDAKQWNWECHTVSNITYNNIKGLSPFCHAWVDGLDLTSGRNVVVNGAITLGNDDTFASGHYNPSDEFPRRFLEELDRASGQNKADMEAMQNRICAAAAIYNKERLVWDSADSENITVNNVLAWSAFANNVRLGANTCWQGSPGEFTSFRLKSYSFNNFNSVMRNSGTAILVHNGSHKSYPGYESLVFRNCSFAGNSSDNTRFPAGSDLTDFNPAQVIIENCWFKDPAKPFNFRNIRNLTLKDFGSCSQGGEK